jgi:hypothetical protein
MTKATASDTRQITATARPNQAFLDDRISVEPDDMRDIAMTSKK